MRIRYFGVLLLLGLLHSSIAYGTAAPDIRPPFIPDGSRNSVYVCLNARLSDCDKANNPGAIVEYSTFSHYIEQVLTNEWDSRANSESLKAGAVAIRSFSERTIGCGAYTGYTIKEPFLPLPMRILFNRSQVYKFSDSGHNCGSYNCIENRHKNARDDTDDEYLREASYVAACVKYNSDNGNPTIIGPGNLIGVPDTTDSNHPVFDQTEFANSPNNCRRPGMSQNGSVAWSGYVKSGVSVDNLAPWNYCQILSHCYPQDRLACGIDIYRWVWLDVDKSKVSFAGPRGRVWVNPDTCTVPGSSYLYWTGDDYYPPVANVPKTLETNQIVPVTINVQNTGLSSWSTGNIKLSYHWYTAWGSLVTWNGERGDLPYNLSPGQSAQITVNVRTPSSSGNYEIRFDMVHEGVTWFSQQNNWPTLNAPVTITEPDTTPPSNPTSQSGSHNANQWSGDNTVYARWDGASDNRTPTNELAYSIAWTQSASTRPNTSVDRTVNNDTSDKLEPDGDWYLHVRTRDNAGNWNSGAAHFGPFRIDTTSPSGTHRAPEWSPTANFDVDWSGFDSGSGVVFGFDYRLNNNPYQNWFTTSSPIGQRTYNQGAAPNDVVTIRSCVQDVVGNLASPHCTETKTQFRNAPYLQVAPAELSHCFILTETVPYNGAILVQNNGPDFLDWTAVSGHPNLSLSPTVKLRT